MMRGWVSYINPTYGELAIALNASDDEEMIDITNHIKS
jgi:hypothetical protein